MPRIGSLCSGYGGLDLAVMEAVPGAEVAWHAQHEPPDKRGRHDPHQYAAQILTYRWPGVPNLGDIVRADWFDAEPVDILTAGYPCQPISFAGQGKVTSDVRWIWPAVAQAIRLLRPAMVYLENVSAHLLRGFTAVLTDLARLGYVGSWMRLRASDVGAPHQRERLFVLARPADADPGRQPRQIRTGLRESQPGGQRLRRPDHGDRQTVSDAASDRWHQGQPEPARQLWRPDVALGSGAPPNATSEGLEAGRQGWPGAGIDFGPYAQAVRRWETILGRPAPAPTDERGRLAPRFVEWMMGAPDGWVTDVPGIPRSAQLKTLGNGVVLQQGAAAWRILHQRLTSAIA